jgi:PLD-like domain
MNRESNFIEDLRRFDNRSGFDLVGCQEVGLPVYKITVDVLTQVRKPIPPIEEYVLKSIDAGLSSEEEIAGLLGLEFSTIREAMVTLRVSEDIDLIAHDVSQLQIWKLTKKGEKTLREAKIIIPEERTFEINFDGLLRTPRWYGQSEKTLLKPKNLRDEGIVEIEPSPNRPPELSDLKIKDIDAIIQEIEKLRERNNKNLQEQDLLALKAIERRQRFFQSATALVYKSKDGNEIQVSFIIDDVLSSEHETAFARADGIKKLRIADSLKQSDPYKLAEEILGAKCLDRIALAKSKELNSDLLTAQIKINTAQESFNKIEVDEEKDMLLQKIVELEEEIKKIESEKSMLSTQNLEMYDHRPLLEKAIRDSEERLMIISPWINSYSVDKQFLAKFERLIKRGVMVYIGYGINDGKDQNNSNRKAEKELRNLAKKYPHNFTLKRLGDTHAKVLISDTKFAVTTSFNWLSFKGERDRTFRDERGTLFSDPIRISELFDDLLKRLTEGS